MWSSHKLTGEPELQCECGDGTEQLDGNRSHNMTKLNNSTINVFSACDVLKVLCCIFFITSTTGTENAEVWRQSSMRAAATRNVHGTKNAKQTERGNNLRCEVFEVNCVRVCESEPRSLRQLKQIARFKNWNLMHSIVVRGDWNNKSLCLASSARVSPCFSAFRFCCCDETLQVSTTY